MSLRIPAVVAAVAFFAGAGTAAAQDGPLAPECTAQPAFTRDGCQKAIDVFHYFAPQLGALVAGGNPELGRGGTLGGLGHFALGVRATALRSPVPQLQNVRLATTGAVRSQVGVQGTWVGFPVADAAIGVFNGIPLGLTTVGGVDLLLNVAYVPTVNRQQVAIRTTGSSFQLGYGARVGILRESAFVPGVAVSALRRETPSTSVLATTDAGDRFGLRDARVRADSWRLTASKNLVLIALAVGVGEDRYTTRGALEASVGLSSLGNFPGIAGVATVSGVRASQTLRRRNYFADVTLLNLPFVKLVGEIGHTSGGSLPATYNSFDGRRPDAAYTYGSAGVRAGF